MQLVLAVEADRLRILATLLLKPFPRTSANNCRSGFSHDITANHIQSICILSAYVSFFYTTKMYSIVAMPSVIRFYDNDD